MTFVAWLRQHQHATASPSTNGTPTLDDAPQAGPPSSRNEEDDDFADIPF